MAPAGPPPAPGFTGVRRPAAPAAAGPVGRLPGPGGRRPAAGRRRRGCWARPTSPAPCRCGRWGSATCSTPRSRSSASTPAPPSGRPYWWPRWPWCSRSSLTAVLTWTIGHHLRRRQRHAQDGERPRSACSRPTARCGFGGVLQSIGLIFVTGMIAHVTAAAAIGRQLSLGQAWAATAGKRWRLVGLAAILGSQCSSSLSAPTSWPGCWSSRLRRHRRSSSCGAWSRCPSFVAALWFFWIRCYYLPVPALMLEDVGDLRRDRPRLRLTRRQFWRTVRHRPADRDPRPGRRRTSSPCRSAIVGQVAALHHGPAATRS